MAARVAGGAGAPHTVQGEWRIFLPLSPRAAHDLRRSFLQNHKNGVHQGTDGGDESPGSCFSDEWDDADELQGGDLENVYDSDQRQQHQFQQLHQNQQQMQQLHQQQQQSLNQKQQQSSSNLNHNRNRDTVSSSSPSSSSSSSPYVSDWCSPGRTRAWALTYSDLATTAGEFRPAVPELKQDDDKNQNEDVDEGVETRTDVYITLSPELGLKFRNAQARANGDKKPLLELKRMRVHAPGSGSGYLGGVEDWRKVLKAKLKRGIRWTEPEALRGALKKLEKEHESIAQARQLLDIGAVHLPDSAERYLRPEAPAAFRPTPVEVAKRRRQIEVGPAVLELAEMQIRFLEQDLEQPQTQDDKQQDGCQTPAAVPPAYYHSVCIEGPLNTQAARQLGEAVIAWAGAQQLPQSESDNAGDVQDGVSASSHNHKNEKNHNNNNHNNSINDKDDNSVYLMDEILVGGYPELLLMLQAKHGVAPRRSQRSSKGDHGPGTAANHKQTQQPPPSGSSQAMRDKADGKKDKNGKKENKDKKDKKDKKEAKKTNNGKDGQKSGLKEEKARRRVGDDEDAAASLGAATRM